MRTKNNSRGIGLLNILAVMILLGIIVIVSIPIYKKYRARAYFYQLVEAAKPYQVAVEACYQKQGGLSECDSGTYDIPEGIYEPKEHVASLSVEDGVITVVPVPDCGITSEDIYVLTPSPLGSALQWEASGGGVENGYVN